LKDVEYDLLIICGDITDFGHYAEARSLLRLIPGPFLAIHGNCDHEDVLTALDEAHCNLHRKVVTVQGELLAGFGGSHQFMGRTPSEYTEEYIYRGLSSIPQDVILVTHAPPENTLVDKAFKIRHVGSTAVRRIIEEKKPKIALCGHIHESKNTDHIGKTLIINPGKFSKGCYAILSTGTGECSLEQLR
jgi:hypothetical protein